MSEKKQESALDGREIPLLIVLLGGAGWYKYGYSIQLWFHENLVAIVLCGILVLVAVGYLLVRRFNKKNDEEIERMRRLQQAKAPNQSPSTYYQRRPNRDNRYE